MPLALDVEHERFTFLNQNERVTMDVEPTWEQAVRNG
jgi:hypothetical protein